MNRRKGEKGCLLGVCLGDSGRVLTYESVVMVSNIVSGGRKARGLEGRNVEHIRGGELSHARPRGLMNRKMPRRDLPVWRVDAFGSQSRKTRVSFRPTHITTAVEGLMSSNWIRKSGVLMGSYCTAQGAFAFHARASEVSIRSLRRDQT